MLKQDVIGENLMKRFDENEIIIKSIEKNEENILNIYDPNNINSTDNNEIILNKYINKDHLQFYIIQDTNNNCEKKT